MKVGKLSSEDLESLIIKKINFKNEDIFLKPGVGEDCAAISFGDYACVLSTDPITGTASEVGKLAVHISCNDVASSGIRPLGLLLTIMAPESITKEELEYIMRQASEEADKIGVDIIGGHTEITTAVNRVVVSSTAIGKQLKSKVVKTAGAKLGDAILMTKSAGLEGTGIIAFEKEQELSVVMTQEQISYCKKMLDKVSVVPEGVICGEYGVTSMHDVTEGGVLGAIWEVCMASEVGCEIVKESITVEEVTNIISKHYDIDPLKLISSGVMLITVDGDRSESLIGLLEAEGIECAEIGRIVEASTGIVYKGTKEEIPSPESDELYKVVD